MQFFKSRASFGSTFKTIVKKRASKNRLVIAFIYSHPFMTRNYGTLEACKFIVFALRIKDLDFILRGNEI
jgi:hypothetical protein